jgi:hypothetical protein
MRDTDEAPNITPDDNQDTSTPLPGVQPSEEEIPEGIDTIPESKENGPNVPGQPEKPDVVGGL